jgi:hypothetical protein
MVYLFIFKQLKNDYSQVLSKSPTLATRVASVGDSEILQQRHLLLRYQKVRLNREYLIALLLLFHAVPQPVQLSRYHGGMSQDRCDIS